jgi:hypothetical protein
LLKNTQALEIASFTSYYLFINVSLLLFFSEPYVAILFFELETAFQEYILIVDILISIFFKMIFNIDILFDVNN